MGESFEARWAKVTTRTDDCRPPVAEWVITTFLAWQHNSTFIIITITICCKIEADIITFFRL